MSVVADAASTSAAPSLLVEHRPWWRSRVTLTAAIVGVMLVCYFALKAEYPWPAALTWNTLPTHLNDFQTWLVDQRNAESPSFVIRAFNGFADFLDSLVNWFTSFLAWMTWVGVSVGGVLVSLQLRCQLAKLQRADGLDGGRAQPRVVAREQRRDRLIRRFERGADQPVGQLNALLHRHL